MVERKVSKGTQDSSGDSVVSPTGLPRVDTQSLVATIATHRKNIEESPIEGNILDALEEIGKFLNGEDRDGVIEMKDSERRIRTIAELSLGLPQARAVIIVMNEDRRKKYYEEMQRRFPNTQDVSLSYGANEEHGPRVTILTIHNLFVINRMKGHERTSALKEIGKSSVAVVDMPGIKLSSTARGLLGSMHVITFSNNSEQDEKTNITSENLIYKYPETCVHYFIIEAATGNESPGKCKKCGEQRSFNNGAVNTYDTSALSGNRTNSHLSGGYHRPDYGLGEQPEDED